MPDLAIQEVYISTRAQKIYGEVYSPGEVIPNAETIPTLPQLLQAKWIERHPMAVAVEPQANKVEDLGSSEFNVESKAEESGEDNGKGKKKTKKRRGRPRKKKTSVV